MRCEIMSNYHDTVKMLQNSLRWQKLSKKEYWRNYTIITLKESTRKARFVHKIRQIVYAIYRKAIEQHTITFCFELGKTATKTPGMLAQIFKQHFAITKCTCDCFGHQQRIEAGRKPTMGDDDLVKRKMFSQYVMYWAEQKARDHHKGSNL